MNFPKHRRLLKVPKYLLRLLSLKSLLQIHIKGLSGLFDHDIIMRDIIVVLVSELN